MDRKAFFQHVEEHRERLDLPLIERAYDFSARAHEGQKRLTGEDFISHCAEVAGILLDLNLDSVTIASGLIHDVVEDTPTTLADVRAAFGPEIATIVDGLTKIAGIHMSSTEERQVENYRKMLLSMAKDIRIILVKFADRLHNMRTLDPFPEEKRRRIAQETREIYAPLAHRFGMAQVRWELEDLSFKYLEPEEYKTLARKVAQTRRDRERTIELLHAPLAAELVQAGIAAEITGRPKHLYSIYRKMVARGKPYEEIYDLMAIRILVDDVRDCYHALGIVHTLGTPLQERFKDYIATPKSNMYQSLHTTIYGPEGQLFEVQIRTREMHRTGEFGIAAHWKYKEGVRRPSELDDSLAWVRQVLDWQQEMMDPREFMEYLRIDLFREEIFVFTPQGELKQLPAGSTPIDFAFAVHTEVGYHCAGAKVNGQMVPLHRRLRSGDTVEILTSPAQRPSRDWIAFVRTSRARSKIKHWIREEEFQSSLALGREMMDREIRRGRHAKPAEEDWQRVVGELGMKDPSHLLSAVGRGSVSAAQVLGALFPGREPPRRHAPSAFERLVERVKGSSRAIRIQGIDNLMVRYAQCCQPVPGDAVVGYVTRGRGISVHRADCPNVLQFGGDADRRVEIDWNASKDSAFLVRLIVRGTDRKGLFADVASAISETSTNIRSADLRTADCGMEGVFVVEVEDLDQLKRVIGSMKKVKGITGVERKESLPERDAREGDGEGRGV